MRLTMSDRRVLIKAFAPRYPKSRKKKKGELWDEFTKDNGRDNFRYSAEVPDTITAQIGISILKDIGTPKRVPI